MDGLKEVLSAGYASSGFSAALLGALAHITIIRNLFVEEHLTEIFTTYAISIVGLGVAYSVIVGLSLLEIILRLTWAATAFNLGLFLSIGIYRASFHPLRQFPGPFLSKITRFYDAYLAGRNIQYHVEIGKLHETYGDFIRTGSLAILPAWRSNRMLMNTRATGALYCRCDCRPNHIRPDVQMSQIDMVCSSLHED